jgi:tetratricopeptide (TPR) repeat protein
MTIADPHAVPETEAATHEYLTEADQAWDANNSDHAYDLYFALQASHFTADHARSHASYRLGLIAQQRGDHDLAHHFLSMTHEPGAAEALHALNAGTTEPDIDPSVVPADEAQYLRYANKADEYRLAGDHAKALELFTAASQCTATNPSTLAVTYYWVGWCHEHLNEADLARQWYEYALPNANSETVGEIRKRLHALGVHVDATDATPAAAQVAVGIAAYENGDATGARTALEAALHLEGEDSEKGRAHYYLGAMLYQQHHYADSRNHIDAAVADAPEPENSWAQAALQWHWDTDQ